jgi:hypothetical protein
MKKSFRYTAIFFGALFALFIVLSFVVKFYLTDERVRGLLLPRLEEATGRSVAMESIQVGLLRGITVSDFSVK